MQIMTKTAGIQTVIDNLRKAVQLNYGVKMEAGWSTDVSQYIKLISELENLARFLNEISHVPVADTSGKIRKFTLSGFSEQRLENRNPQDMTGQSERGYSLAIVDNDTIILYDDLDSYSLVGSPKTYIQNVNRDIAMKLRMDELHVGWNGTSRATWASDANGLDIDKGWLKRIEDDAASQVIDEIRVGSGVIVVGPTRVVMLDGAATDKGGGKTGLPSLAHDIPVNGLIHVAGTTNYNGTYTVEVETTENEIVITKAYNAETLSPATAKATCPGDYANLDELVSDLSKTIVENKRYGLKAIMADSLDGSEQTDLYGAQAGTPTEKILVQQALSMVGNLPKRTPYAFPDNTILVTPPQNLAIYLHKVWRRKMEDKEEKRGLVSWSERKRDFIVSDYDRVIMAKNIVKIKANPSVT